MKVTIKIQCDNAAFSDSPEPEVARILLELADDLAFHSLIAMDGQALHDFNGNTVGTITVSGKG